jgi:hypothetical protein
MAIDFKLPLALDAEIPAVPKLKIGSTKFSRAVKITGFVGTVSSLTP